MYTPSTNPSLPRPWQPAGERRPQRQSGCHWPAEPGPGGGGPGIECRAARAIAGQGSFAEPGCGGRAAAKHRHGQNAADRSRPDAAPAQGQLLDRIVTGTPAAWGPGRARVPASLSPSQARAQAQTQTSPEPLALSAAAAIGTLSHPRAATFADNTQVMRILRQNCTNTTGLFVI